MANAFNIVIEFVINYWGWIVTALLLIPNLMWWLETIAWNFEHGLDGARALSFRIFWYESTRIDENWEKEWLRKFLVFINLISLFWLWGYILSFIARVIGRVVRWL